MAVPEFQHSPTLGQRASSQTVTSRFSRISEESWVTPSPTGALTVSHGGRRSTPSGRSRCQVGRWPRGLGRLGRGAHGHERDLLHGLVPL